MWSHVRFKSRILHSWTFLYCRSLRICLLFPAPESIKRVIICKKHKFIAKFVSMHRSEYTRTCFQQLLHKALLYSSWSVQPRTDCQLTSSIKTMPYNSSKQTPIGHRLNLSMWTMGRKHHFAGETWTDMIWIVAHIDCRKWLPSSLDIPTFRCLRNGRQVGFVYTYKIETFFKRTSPFHNCTHCKFALEPCGQGILHFCHDHSLF